MRQIPATLGRKWGQSLDRRDVMSGPATAASRGGLDVSEKRANESFGGRVAIVLAEPAENLPRTDRARLPRLLEREVHLRDRVVVVGHMIPMNGGGLPV